MGEFTTLGDGLEGGPIAGGYSGAGSGKELAMEAEDHDFLEPLEPFQLRWGEASARIIHPNFRLLTL
jgi:hypothetical protein